MLRQLKWALCNLAIFGFLGYVNIAYSAPQQKEWTFLVYINGNNNLDSFGKFNIKQMEKVGSTDQVNVVVQWASLANKKTQRLFITQSDTPGAVTSPVVDDLGNVDMGDWNTLVKFIQWGVENYPAKHYFIDVWDHGSGWHAQKLGSRKSFNPMDISWDDNSGNFITTPQLGQAMAEAARIIGHKVDIYGSDACLMAMAEIATEMKDSVAYYIGSQDLEPGEGWPYDAILKAWNSTPAASSEEVAKIVTEQYVKSYQGGQNGDSDVTFSAYNLEKSDRLYTAMSELNRRLRKLDASNKKKALKAFTSSQMFYYSDYRDLLDLVDQLEKAKLTQALGADTFAEIRQAIQEYVIVNSATAGYRMAKGLSIWLPTSLFTYNSHSNYYNMLKFQADTQWGDTLHEVLDPKFVNPIH